MNSLEQIRRIAEVEFTAIVVQTDLMSAKLRVLLVDDSYVDVWASRKIHGRFGFHWERRHLDEHIYRYDNFPWNDCPRSICATWRGAALLARRRPDALHHVFQKWEITLEEINLACNDLPDIVAARDEAQAGIGMTPDELRGYRNLLHFLHYLVFARQLRHQL